MVVKSKSDINSFMNKLSATVKNISEAAFKEKVNDIYKKLKGDKVFEELRNKIADYLLTNKRRTISGILLPDVISSNLRKKIISNGVIGKPIIKPTSAGLRATITTWVGIDNDGSGNNTVLNAKKGNAPYAKYLNENSKFYRFNGFFKIVKNQYGKVFKQDVTSLLEKEFGKNISGFKSEVFRY